MLIDPQLDVTPVDDMEPACFNDSSIKIISDDQATKSIPDLNEEVPTADLIKKEEAIKPQETLSTDAEPEPNVEPKAGPKPEWDNNFPQLQ